MVTDERLDGDEDVSDDVEPDEFAGRPIPCVSEGEP